MGFLEINQISVVLAVCTAMAVLFANLKQPTILGYIMTGVFLGPFALNCIRSADAVKAIGEYGILIMLFTVGLKLNVHEFRKVWKTAITTLVIQTIFGSLIGLALGGIFGLDNLTISLIMCMIILSSTAIAVKLLENANEINTQLGSVVISILIAQDLALVPMVMMMKSFIFNQNLFSLIIKISISILSITGTVIFLSKKNLDFLYRFFNSWVFKISEINSLISITACFVSAALAEYLGLSGVYGAFLCGFILGNIGPKSSLLAFSAPLSGTLMMSFFIYIGMLFNVRFIMNNILYIFLLVICLTIVKFFINIISLKILGWKKRIAVESSLLLTQVSEFAFVLINIYALGNNTNPNFINLIISTTVISLSVGALFIVSIKNIIDKS
ncbi:MAG: cation:proton antiporter [Alphaproteobacteria bacterium]|nr:MAG: cation:proton antiporter [Alphaproteobacteria bacterium]